MLTLALDTATEHMSLALASGDGLLVEEGYDAGRQHLEELLPRILKMLHAHGREFSDLESVIAGLGPGTFSGLRVGIATARALAQALEIPIGGCSSLNALALGLVDSAGRSTGSVMPVIDAKRGQVFTRVFRTTAGGSLKGVSGIECLDPEELESFAVSSEDGPVLTGGNGAQAYYGILSQMEGIELLPLDDRGHLIRAANLLEAVKHEDGAEEAPSREKTSGFSLEMLKSLMPIYVREPDADRTVLLRKREPWQI